MQASKMFEALPIHSNHGFIRPTLLSLLHSVAQVAIGGIKNGLLGRGHDDLIGFTAVQASMPAVILVAQRLWFVRAILTAA